MFLSDGVHSFFSRGVGLLCWPCNQMVRLTFQRANLVVDAVFPFVAGQVWNESGRMLAVSSVQLGLLFLLGLRHMELALSGVELATPLLGLKHASVNNFSLFPC